VYFFHVCRMYLPPKRIFVMMVLDAQPLFRLELHYATDTRCCVVNLPTPGMVFAQTLTVVFVPT
jgi:hypothetical protein